MAANSRISLRQNEFFGTSVQPWMILLVSLLMPPGLSEVCAAALKPIAAIPNSSPAQVAHASPVNPHEEKNLRETDQLGNATSKFDSKVSAKGLKKDSPSDLQFDHLEQSTAYLRYPDAEAPAMTIPLDLFEPTYIGTIKPAPGEGPPYFLFSGKLCKDCDEDLTLSAYRPSGGKPTRFLYPGKILDPKNRSVLIESRAFFGKCLRGRGEVYVAFQRENIDRRHRHMKSVYVAEAEKSFFDETLIERHLPSIKSTTPFVKQKVCHEIRGRNRMMLSQPFDLQSKLDLDEDADEEQKTQE